MLFIVFLLVLLAVAIAQHLVLIGGNLKDEHVGILDIMIEKALASFDFRCFLFSSLATNFL
jgi:hypothetical protein